MGIAYRCDAVAGLSISVWDGTIGVEESMEHLATLAADPDWTATRYVITDLSGVASESVPNDKRIAELADGFRRTVARRVAIVKWSLIAERAFGSASAFETNLGHEVKRMIVFNSLGPACVWMGLETHAVQHVIDELRAGLRTSPA